MPEIAALVRLSITLAGSRLRLAMLAASLAIVCGFAFAVLAQDAPKLVPEAAPSDCAACHGDKSPFSRPHPPTTGMTMATCQGCHAKNGPMTLRTKIPASHVHQLSGVRCAVCHADPKDAEAPKADKCLSCHVGEAVAAATAQVKPTNPHNSPHYGKESDCNLCHHQHEKSENYCTQCHKFEFRVP
jgi:hypothetical protein